MHREEFKNILIIGAGPAGEAAATTIKKNPAGSGSRVILIEKDQAGGLCLNKGCIPSKTLLKHVRALGTSKHPLNWADLQKVKATVVTGIRTALEARLKREGIELIKGEATFISKDTVQIQNGSQQTFQFDKAILATGTDIYYPSALLPVKDQLLTSDTILELTRTPTSILIIGGGAVGLEFACLLNAAGSKVTVIEMKETILPGEDEAVVTLLTGIFESRGIVIKTTSVVDSINKTGAAWKVKLSTGEDLEFEEVLTCVGRTPAKDKLGLDKADIQLKQNKLIVNPQLQTTNPNIYAAGDVAGSRLAHHASSQGETAARNALGGREIHDDRFIPRCLYTWPEVASIGAWKYQLEGDHRPVKATRAFFKGSAKAIASGETEGFIQIISEPDTHELLGAQIIGPHATELIHIFSVALKAKMTTNDLGDVMFAHPTLSELIKEAARK